MLHLLFDSPFAGPRAGVHGHEEAYARHPPGRHGRPAGRRGGRFERAVPLARLAAVSPGIPAVLPGCGRVRRCSRCRTGSRACWALVALPSTMPPLLWHAHEMLFGFAVAVIVGFLLTAGKAWTGLATPRGATLAAMAGLWLAARLSAVGAPYAVYAVLDVVLLPWVAVVLIRVLLKAGNRRNLPLGAILVLLATANLAFHAAVLGWLDIDPLRALHAGLALVVMIECVIAGRVIPAFTMSALPGRQLQVPAWLERHAGRDGAVAGGVGAAAGQPGHGGGVRRWRRCCMPRACGTGSPGAPGRVPSCGCCMRRMPGCPSASCCWPGRSSGVAASAGIHALAVGATAGLIIGMITRTASGHTGRPLKVSRLEVAAYLLVARR